MNRPEPPRISDEQRQKLTQRKAEEQKRIDDALARVRAEQEREKQAVEAEKSEQAKAKAEEVAKQRAEEAEVMKERTREAFMRVPGATEADFATAWPMLKLRLIEQEAARLEQEARASQGRLYHTF